MKSFMLEFRLCLPFGFTIIGTTQSINQSINQSKIHQSIIRTIDDQSILLIFDNATASYYKNGCYRYSLAAMSFYTPGF